MKKIKIAIFLAMYISSMLSIWYLPIGSIISLSGYRAKYDDNYSLQEVEERLLQTPIETPLFIDFLKIYTRLFSIWTATGIALLICHLIEKKRKLKCEQKDLGDSVPPPQI